MSFFRKMLTLLRRFILLLVFVLELALIFSIFVTKNKHFEIFKLVCETFGVLFSIYIIAGKKQSAYKILWVFYILTFPILGVLSYVFSITEITAKRFKKSYVTAHALGMEARQKISSSIDELEAEKTDVITSAKYLENVRAYNVTAGNDTEFYTPGERFFEELLKEISLAERYIFLEYFIFGEGKMLTQILDILKEKAKNGVKVRIIYDDIGSFLTLRDDFPLFLSGLGIECVKFNKFIPLISGIHNNRDHRKIACIDGTVAFTGGINISDEYINERERFGHWLDCAVKIKGAAAWSLTAIFLENWCFATKRTEDFSIFLPVNTDETFFGGYVQPYADSPLDSEPISENVYLKLINGARASLDICTPYLIPSENILSALKIAAKSGVKVRIITPKRWDKRYVHVLTRSFYQELIDSGVEIYEYKHGFIHSKIFVCDGNTATVGTANLDYRSLYLNFECGTILYGTASVTDIEEAFEKTVEHSEKIEKQQLHVGIFGRILRTVLRIFAPLL